MYSAQLLDHFQNPRNAGDLMDADVVVEIENPVCGDVIRLSVKFEAGRISAIRFKAKGCVPAMACGSALFTREILAESLSEKKLNMGNSDKSLRQAACAVLHNNSVALYRIGEHVSIS